MMFLVLSHDKELTNVDHTNPQAISDACGLNWLGKSAVRGLHHSSLVHVLYVIATLNLAMKPAAPPLCCMQHGDWISVPRAHSFQTL